MIVRRKKGKWLCMEAAATATLLWLLLMLASTWCQEESSFKTVHSISSIAASKRHIFVVAGNTLYQLNTSLQLEVKVMACPSTQAKCTGSSKESPHNDQNNVSKLLIVYEEGGVVFTGWFWDNGVIENRSLTDVSQVIKNQTGVVSSIPGESSRGVAFKYDGNNVLAIAAVRENVQKTQNESNISVYNAELIVEESSTLKYTQGETLHFVDAFVWGSSIFTPLEEAGKLTMVITDWDGALTLHGEVTLRCNETKNWSKVVSSTLIKSETDVFWAGIFTLKESSDSSDKTALCIFNLTSVKSQAKGHFSNRFTDGKEKNKNIVPVPEIWMLPTLTHSNLSSVHGLVVRKHIVVFMGTGNGQLLKVTLGKDMKAGCTEILYEIKEETPVFPKLLLDPIDNRYIYLPTTNEVKRVKVSKCGQYESCKQCLLAMDAYCGWCHSQTRCTFQGDCVHGDSSEFWVSITEGADQCLPLQFTHGDFSNETIVTVMTNFTQPPEKIEACQVRNTVSSTVICKNSTPGPLSCSCKVEHAQLSDDIIAEILINKRNMSERFQFKKCSQMQSGCSDCVRNGCVWCEKEESCKSHLTSCNLPGKDAGQMTCTINDMQWAQPSSPPVTGNTTRSQVIDSIDPKRLSTKGKINVTIIGHGLTEEAKIVLIGTSTCSLVKVKVIRKLNDTHLLVSLPPGRKETKTLCINFDGKKCLQGKTIPYTSVPTCSEISPNKTWLSGGRRINIIGKNVDVADYVTVSHEPRGDPLTTLRCSGNETHCQLLSPQFEREKVNWNLALNLHTGDYMVNCGQFKYLADPRFTSFNLQTDIDAELGVTIMKENDDLDIKVKDLEVVVMYANKTHPCAVQNITRNSKNSVIHCKLKKDVNHKVQPSQVKVMVLLGHFNVTIHSQTPPMYWYFLVIIPVLLVVIFGVAIWIMKRKSKQMSRKLSEQLELLESDLRNQIRHGFAELQMDQSDVVDTWGAIPFLDYKHFAIRTFFPESTNPNSNFIEELCNAVPPPFQNSDTAEKDEGQTLLRALICNKGFLVTLIHTLDTQKAFSIRDRCIFASYLTIALQSKLVYLTHILEVLIRDFMEQASNAQPKLMLRRTESVVEKLLTNWMSTCLYGFLRETVGEPLYLLVTTLNQRIHKGPVDAITCKALYTLNEDWLLWQVTEFSTVALNVFFPKMSDTDSEEDAGWNIPVKVLDCDSIGQAKEKFFQAFLSKNGYPYGLPLCETSLELHVGQECKELLDVDQSSVILEHGKTKINTVMHYQIKDGATINVIKKNSSCTSDGDYSDKHCHLILSDSEEAEDSQGAQHKGKEKFKVKEMFLTKLISTKVAIDSAVEPLFRSIWSVPGKKVPVAIKFFFDFLDAQYESKKINDPDVLHIWKTNSLPLRFWVNILKNPQFVFDIKKTPHLDGCLSVITQAFMDSFSLSEQMLSKESPTNKLLYAKDIARYKREVKEYYKEIQDFPSLSSKELEEFLTQESKKHENEFNEDTASLELYKYISKFYNEILSELEKEPELEEARKQLAQVRSLLDKKKIKWM